MENNRHIGRAKYADDHRGVNVEEVHEHAAMAKYVFPPTPRCDKTWEHDHEEHYRDPERRLAHIAGHHHRGEDSTGRHEHISRVKDRSLSLAARIDVHPSAIEKLPGARHVFFVIEGCIKADAVLSAGEAVCSVPSVTLWDCAELSAFTAKYLLGRVVVIVPDSDWEDIGAVVTQARLLQTRLRQDRVLAQIAAPPQPAPGVDGKRKKVGVDDFLLGGGSMDDLDVIDRLPSPHLQQFAEDTARRSDQAKRTFDVLWALSMHASRQGEIRVSLRLLSRIMGIPVMRISRGVQDLEELGAISIDGDLSISRGRFIGRGQYIHQVDWEDMPTFTIREDLRAIDESRRTLADRQPLKTWSAK